MAKDTTPKKNRTAATPTAAAVFNAPDPTVGIVCINPDHPTFGTAAGVPLAEQMSGIWGNKPENLSEVGLLVAINRDRNVVGVASVKAWSRPTPALLPHRGEDGFKKHGSVAVGAELIPNHPLLGKSIAALQGSYVYGVTKIALSQLKASIGNANPERVKPATVNYVEVVQQQYSF